MDVRDRREPAPVGSTVFLDASDQAVTLGQVRGLAFPPIGCRTQLPGGRKGTVAGTSLVVDNVAGRVLVWVDLDPAE